MAEFCHPWSREAILTLGGGIYNNDPAEAKADEAAPLVLPASRALYLAPANLKEAVQAVQEAQKHGFTALWVQVPDNGDAQVLKAALQAGQKVHLPVYAVVRLLSRTAGMPGSMINILDKPLSDYLNSRPPQYYAGDLLPKTAPRDWARLDDPGLFSRLQSQLMPLLKMPGLSGLVLCDSAAPGFDLPPADASGRYAGGRAAEGDYAPDIRLAFLRQYGADPVDIVPYTNYDDYDNPVDLPLFPDDADLAKQWRTFRYTANQSLLARLYASMRLVRPSLPLLVQVHSRYWIGNWFGSWDKSDVIPYAPGSYSPNIANMARARSKQILIDHPATPSDNNEADYVTSLKNRLNASGKGWDGLVLDFSVLPVTKVWPLLDNLPISNSSSPTASGKTP